jgi:hypothetical protein
LNLTTNFNIFSDYYLYSQYTDYDDETLEKFISSILDTEENLSIYQEYDENGDYLTYLQNNRKFKEIVYLKNVFTDIKNKREQRYLVPIKGS